MCDVYSRVGIKPNLDTFQRFIDLVCHTNGLNEVSDSRKKEIHPFVDFAWTSKSCSRPSLEAGDTERERDKQTKEDER